MGAFDGNNSLKRFLRIDRAANNRTFESDYFIPNDYVNQFKDEVKGRARKPDNSAEVQTLCLAIYLCVTKFII
jgi:Kyakuja-Dileera-Zisupton transposase